MDLDRLDALRGLEGVVTTVETRLPYRIPGADGTFEVMCGDRLWRVSLHSHRMPLGGLEANLEGLQIQTDPEGFAKSITHGQVTHHAPKKKFLHLVPDRWGRCCRWNATVSCGGVIPFPKPRRNVDLFLQRTVCDPFNRMLTGLGYAGGPVYFSGLVPNDLWSFKATWRHDGEIKASCQQGMRQELWWADKSLIAADVLSRAKDFIRNDVSLPVDAELMVSARRKVEHGDGRGAILDAVTAVEVSVGRLLQNRLIQRGIGGDKIEDLLGANGATLHVQVAVLVPALFRESDVHLLGSFQPIRRKRNDIAHRGHSIDLKTAKEYVQTCREVRDHLEVLGGDLL